MRRFLWALAAAAAMTASGSVDLNGTWELSYFPQPDDGAVRRLEDVPEGVGTVSATVPGNCELDLIRAGRLPDAETGLNAQKLRPYEGYQWLYTKTFPVPEIPTSARSVLVFEGIDTLADVFLNGKRIGGTENMLIPHEFDVTGSLRTGENTVQVLIRSVAIEAQDKSLGEIGYSLGGINQGDCEPFRKAAHMGGWDIFPRVYVAGLWRSVRLEMRPPVRIDEPVWIVSGLDPTNGTATLYGRCRVHAPFRYLGTCNLRVTLSGNDDIVATQEQVFNGYLAQLRELKVEGIRCWWPRGMGDPMLYDAKIELVAADGKVLAENVTRIGFRSVRLIREDYRSPERPGEFLFVVNGEPCYVRGSNWVPLDAFHGRDGERMEETLEMFGDLNCNMIRVWGGGVYEPDAFFDWCDSHGMMVWQDFMTGCSVFPQDDSFAKAFELEVRSVVKRLRNRASLVIWSGNNENDLAVRWGNPPEFVRDPNLDRLSRKVIPGVLFDMDVSRPYLPSSPYVSPEVFAGLAKPSENHLWGERAYYKAPDYTNAVCRFASEMGYHGCPNRTSLERMMTKDCVYPWTAVTGSDPWKDYRWNVEWQFKSSNPFLDPNLFLSNRNSLMANQTKIMFGSVPTDLDDFIFASQFVQAEAMKTFVELFRSQKFTKKNGLIWWNVRDGWPQISDAVVDYYGGKKRAYYAIRNSQHDQLVMVRDDRKVIAVNDTLRPVDGKVKIVDRESGRVLLEKAYSVPKNAAAEIGLVTWSGQGVLDIAYEQGNERRTNWFLYGEPPFDFKRVKMWME